MIANLSVEQILTRLTTLLAHDEIAWQQRRMIPFRATTRAEFLEIVLFICPQCHHIGRLHSSGNDCCCLDCGYRIHYNRHGLLETRNGTARFETLRDWCRWQREHFLDHLLSIIRGEANGPILPPEPAILYRGCTHLPLPLLCKGALTIDAEHLTVGTTRLPLREISSNNVQHGEHLEFHRGNRAHRITLPAQNGNIYKWNLAIDCLRSAHEQ